MGGMLSQIWSPQEHSPSLPAGSLCINLLMFCIIHKNHDRPGLSKCHATTHSLISTNPIHFCEYCGACGHRSRCTYNSTRVLHSFLKVWPVVVARSSLHGCGRLVLSVTSDSGFYRKWLVPTGFNGRWILQDAWVHACFFLYTQVRLYWGLHALMFAYTDADSWTILRSKYTEVRVYWLPILELHYV